MKGFVGDIEDQAEDNADFRRVVYTGKNLQLVLMSLQPEEQIGQVVHKDRDQFFRIEKGKGEVWIDGKRSKIKGMTLSLCLPAPGTTLFALATSRCGFTRSTPLLSIGTEPCRRRKPKPKEHRSISTARPPKAYNRVLKVRAERRRLEVRDREEY